MLPTYLTIPAQDLGKDTPVKVRILSDMASLGADLAEALKAEILAAQREHRNATFIIPVGPVDQYPVLAQAINREKISCREVVFIGMDEYLTEGGSWLPQEHPLSFRGYLDRMFYDRLDPVLAPPPEHRVFPDPATFPPFQISSRRAGAWMPVSGASASPATSPLTSLLSRGKRCRPRILPRCQPVC